jgi:methyl-accepting chemotaxis protein
MTWLGNLTIGKKLWLGFGLVLVLTCLLGGFSIFEISKVNGNTVDIATHWLSSVQTLGDLGIQVSSFRRNELNYALSVDDQMKQSSEAGMKDSLAQIDKSEKVYEPLMSSEEERRLYNDFRADWDKYLNIHTRVMELLRTNKTEAAARLASTEGRLAFVATLGKISDEVALNKKDAADAAAARYWAIGLLAVALTLGLLVATSLSRSITGGTARMLAMIQEVAANNLGIADMEITSHDELGQAAIALNKMKNNLREIIESIAGTAQNVASASEELSATSQQISANSEETSAQASVVSNATQQVSQNLQTVATGAEEMGASIKEIAKNAGEAARVATSAVQVAESTNATVSKLGESSAEIGQVIKGKGFAVVANEVKELAKETAKATEDISRKIAAIQTDTQASVEAIGTISTVIKQINDISNTIATAVEEQNATTNEMARNVSDAAHGSGEITSNIAGVAQAAESTSRGAGDTQKAAQQLVETSAQLRRLVEQFNTESGKSGNGSTRHARARASDVYEPASV